MEVYFDNAATTAPYCEVVEEVAYAMKNYYGNPSSVHKLGIIAEKKLTYAREVLGSLINADKDEIIFTSGGSESNNFLLKAFLKPGAHIITTRIEHPSILNTVKSLEEDGIEVTYIDVDGNGRVDVETLKSALKKETVLVSIMAVNNEIGIIEDLETIGEIVKSQGKAKFHVDAIQGYGKISIDVKKLNIDLLSASGHKIHGPRGIGFAYVKKNLIPRPLIYGGGQEHGIRSGTENVANALGFAKAAEIVKNNFKDNYEKVTAIKKHFIEGLSKFKDISINSPLEDGFSPYILSVSFKGVRGEVLLHMLEADGIYVSTGSACSSKDKNFSHVLTAIGVKKEYIDGTIRFSFSDMSTIEEVDYTLSTLEKSLKFLRRIRI